MDFDIRPATADEMSQIGLMAAYVYGGAFGDEADNITATSVLPEWTLCAFDGAKLVTSFATFPFTMRANGRAMSMGGVTAVGTLPDYRRRGLVRKIMTQAFEQHRSRGQSVSGLWASQAAIYQRYGYAAAGCNRSYAIDSVDVGFSDGDSGSCKVVRAQFPDCLDQVKSVYRAFAEPRMGYLHRSQILWRTAVYEEQAETGPVHTALAYSGDQVLGYVVYTLRANKVAHPSRSQEIVIRDLAWLDMDAYRSLWSFLGQHDLVGRISWLNAPMDDPAPAIFVEPRQLNTREGEGSWIRIVDVPVALQARGYTSPGSMTIGVQEDSLAPWNVGNWRLEVDAADGHQAQVTSTQDIPDVVLGASALSALFTGMYSSVQLASWGLIKGQPDQILKLNSLFQVRYGPHCPDHY